MNQTFFGAAVLSLVVLTAPNPADACSCAKVTVEQSFDLASDVVHVRHLSSKVVEGPQGTKSRLIRVVATRVFKGRVRRGRTITVRTHPSGKACGLTISKKHGPRVLFLNRDKAGKLHGSSCQKRVKPKSAEYAQLRALGAANRRKKRSAKKRQRSND